MMEVPQQPHSNPRILSWHLTYRRQLVLIGLITLATIGTGWLSFSLLARHLIALSGDTIAVVAADIAAQLDLVIRERYADLQVLSTGLSRSGKNEIFKQELIRTLRLTSPMHVWIGMTDSTGRIVMATDATSVGRSVRHAEWFLAVKERGIIHMGYFRPDEYTAGADAISLTAPIGPDSLDPSRSPFRGVVSTRVGLSQIEELVTKTIRTFQHRGAFFETVGYQILRDDGLVFIDSDMRHKGGHVNFKTMGLPSAFLGRVGQPGFIEEEDFRRRVPVITGYAVTHGHGESTNPGWRVLLRVDRAEILAPLYRFLWMIVVAGLVIVAPMMVWLISAAGRAQAWWIEAEDERARSRESERKLRSILEAEPEGVLVLGPTRRVLQINPAGCMLFDAGFAEEILGRDVAEFVHRNDRRLIEEAYETAREGRESCGKGRIIGLSGRTRWIEMTSVPLPPDDGTVRSVLSVVRDVTEHKCAERRQALQHAVAKVLAEASTLDQAVPELLRAIATSMEWHVGLFWRVQEDQRALTCAQDWSSASTTVQDFVRASRQKAVASGFDLPGRCWARGEPIWVADIVKDSGCSRGPAEAMNTLHAGCAFPIWLRANVFGIMEFFSREIHPQDVDLLTTLGTIGSQIGLFIERAEVEAALRENEARTRLIIDTALDAVITMDSAGLITEWNAQAEQMFGWSHHEVVGRDLAETIIPSVHRNAHRQSLERFRSTEKASVLNTLTEITGLRRDGREFPIELAIAPLRVEESVIFSAFIRDITARKEAEKSLTAYAQQLEQINHQLDAALTEAKAATEAKSSFLATMSHEIRTPMNGVIGMTGLLLDTDLSAEQREYAETVRNCGDHLLTIINDILDFSKIEAGKLNLEIIEFDLRTAIEESLDLLAERASFKGLNLACLFHADVPRELLGDPGRLRQIVMNLAGNAIKFTERGEVVIQVTVDAQTELEATIRIEIMDTGIGVSEEAQERLFESFSQADGSTTRKYGGTGLGLAICKRLVAMMGGTIGVTSQPGQGSCFWFTASLRKHAGAASCAAPPAAVLAGLRALIVDDKAINRKILELLTKKWGMHPTLVDSGPAALDHVGLHPGRPPFDVAILDADMGAMGGLELARLMKERADWAGIHLVLLTSFGRRGDATAAREAGLAAYLTKPIRERQLHDCLVAVMTQQPGAFGALPSDTPSPLITRHTIAETKAKASLRILLAEDNIINQKVAVCLLERLGYRLDVVANGFEAVEALSRIPYDVVFMDCQMPEMDGFQATRVIREREALLAKREEHGEIRTTGGERRGTPRVPIIAMTANAMQGDREWCLAAGMDDYVAKPITVEALAEVLGRWVPPVASPAPQTGMGPIDEEAAIDPLIFNGIRELSGDEAPDFLMTIVGHFLKDVPESVEQMRQALARADLSELAHLAHRLKGSASNVGALGMARMCEQIRATADARAVGRVCELLDTLEQEFKRVGTQLSRETLGGENTQPPQPEQGREAA